MLVLSRKSGEEIMIGKDIRLVVNRISGNRVTIAIKAPQDVHIVRGELKDLVQKADVSEPQEGLASAV
jgi:carbon storage regulator